MGAMVSVAQVRYDAMLDCKARLDGAAAQREELAAWLLAEKGATDVEAGLARCTLDELDTWLTKAVIHIDWCAPISLGREGLRRLRYYAALDEAARADAQVPINTELP